MKDDIKIVQLSKDRLKDVKWLIRKVFRVDISLEKLQHKYHTAVYMPHEYVCTLAYDRDKLIGFYGVIPVVFERNGEQIFMGHTCDSFTLQSYQGQGIHYQLAKASYELLEKAGFKGVYAYHSDNTFHSCKKLGWQEWARYQRAHIKLKTSFPWFKLYSKYALFGSLKKRNIDKSLKDVKSVSTFQNPSKELNLWGLNYSKEYIDYKNKYACHLIEIGGCQLWVKLDSIVIVAGVSGLNQSNIDEVLLGLRRLAKRLKTNEISFQIYPSHPAYQLLNEKLEFLESFRVGYLFFADDVPNRDFHHNYIDMDSVI